MEESILDGEVGHVVALRIKRALTKMLIYGFFLLKKWLNKFLVREFFFLISIYSPPKFYYQVFVLQIFFITIFDSYF